MSAKSILSTVGSFAFGILILLAGLAIVAIFLVGAEWVGAKILPWLVLLCILAIAFNILILGPLALIPPTRPWAGLGFFISSYIFGLTGWFMGFLLTLELWGVFAVLIGLFFLGIGVVPIAILATLFNGMWVELGMLVLAVVLTFGLRMLGLFLTDSSQSDSQTVTYLQDRDLEISEAEDFEDVGNELEEDEDWTDEEDEETDWEDEEDEEEDWEDEEEAENE